MKPCSAWCKPEEGVHVALVACAKPAGSSIGHVYWSRGSICVPPDTKLEVIAEEEPSEAPPGSCKVCALWPHPVLRTMQVLP